MSCEKCKRPTPTKEQWEYEGPLHGNGDGCQCAECCSLCWGDPIDCARATRREAPAIDEKAMLIQENIELREENGKLLVRLANLDSDQIKERNALKEKVADLTEDLAVTNKLREDTARGWNAREEEWGKDILARAKRHSEAVQDRNKYRDELAARRFDGVFMGFGHAGMAHELAQASAELVRLKLIEVAARKLYSIIKGTMAALGAPGLALKEALGEK